MAASYIIGIDLGGTNLKVALFDRKFRLRQKRSFSTRAYRTKNALISAILDAVIFFIKEHSLSRNAIKGIGIGLPGPIDYSKGLVHFLPNIPGWKEVRLQSILEKKLKLPVVLDNDANLMALAEYTLGGARGSRNCLCLTLGTGVGGGIIIEGQLYRGSNFCAGEIGHMPINEQGPNCNCGGLACLETYIGNNRIKAEARRILRRDISLEELSSLAKKGNRKAAGIWIKAGERLGIALAGVVNLLDLDVIVIGGGVANAGSILFDKVRSTIRCRAMQVQAKHIKVVKASLGEDAGMIGAAILAAQRAKS